jgi:hypothetical protein
MSPSDRDPFLVAVDKALLPLGYKRRKSYSEWRLKLDEKNENWVHLNFGLGIINPSFGVRYLDLEKLLPQEAGAVSTVAEMLGEVTGILYSIDTKPNLLAEHLLEHAIPRLTVLSDRNSVAKLLELDMPAKWPVAGISFRMRILPLLLIAEDRKQEAFMWLSKFEKSSPEVDQLNPGYGTFSTYFKVAFND